MGRWKMGPSGGYYDSADSGPDQYTPTASEAASIASPASTARTPPMIPTPGNNGGFGSEGPGGISGKIGQPGYQVDPNAPVDWSDPNRRDYKPDNPIWPAQSTDPSVPGYIDPTKPRPVDPGMGRIINPSILAPGQNGQWGMDGGQGQTIEQILAALQAKFGGSSGSGIIGKLASAIPQSALPRIATAIQASQAAAANQPKRHWWSAAPALLDGAARGGGMALGSLGTPSR